MRARRTYQGHLPQRIKELLLGVALLVQLHEQVRAALSVGTAQQAPHSLRTTCP